ncbi:MAG: nitroreductase family protein [Desulfopila sp.]
MILELLRKRRSIRRFAPRAVEQEKIDYLIESVLRVPSSRSTSPWEFVVVQDSVMLKALAKAKPHGAGFVANAPLVIVVCADPQKCDVWVEDASIAALTLHLAATDLGLGSCWVQIRLREHDGAHLATDYVARQLALPSGLEVEAMVAIGYSQEDKKGHPGDTLLRQRVHFERYGSR